MESKDSSSNVATIVVVIVAFLLVILAVLAVLLYLRRRNVNRRKSFDGKFVNEECSPLSYSVKVTKNLNSSGNSKI